MFIKYLSYIIEHKIFVFIEGRKLGLGVFQLLKHDLSKFSRFEFNQYKKKFFGSEKCSKSEKQKIKNDFDLAWLHHQHKNKHHWQYWLQISGKTIMAYEMPKKYALEMIADWNAMSRKFQDKNNIKKSTREWYRKKTDIILHKNTLAFVENMLEK